MDPYDALSDFMDNHLAKEVEHVEKVEELKKKIAEKEMEVRRLKIKMRIQERIWENQQKEYDDCLEKMKLKMNSDRSSRTSGTGTGALPNSTIRRSSSRQQLIGRKRRHAPSESESETDIPYKTAAAAKKQKNIDSFKKSKRAILTDSEILYYLEKLSWTCKKTQMKSGLGKELVLRTRRGDLRGIFESTRETLSGMIYDNTTVSPLPSSEDEDQPAGPLNRPPRAIPRQ